MYDQALINAQLQRDSLVADIAEHEAQIIKLRQELEKAKAFIDLWHVFAAKTVGLAQSATIPEINDSVDQSDREEVTAAPSISYEFSGPPPSRKRVKGNPKKEFVAEVARKLILEKGVPIPRAELFQGMQQRGLIIQGSDPEMVMSTMLWRVPKMVIRLPGFGYWVPEKPFRPAHYSVGDAEREADLEDIKMSFADVDGTLPETFEDQSGKSDFVQTIAGCKSSSRR